MKGRLGREERNPHGTGQASWDRAEGQPPQPEVLSVARLAQTPLLVVTGSAGNPLPPDNGWLHPLFALTLPRRRSVLGGCSALRIAQKDLPVSVKPNLPRPSSSLSLPLCIDLSG